VLLNRADPAIWEARDRSTPHFCTTLEASETPEAEVDRGEGAESGKCVGEVLTALREAGIPRRHPDHEQVRLTME
jgi:hypothetical protein